jgi:hypothetical protein
MAVYNIVAKAYLYFNDDDTETQEAEKFTTETLRSFAQIHSRLQSVNYTINNEVVKIRISKYTKGMISFTFSTTNITYKVQLESNNKAIITTLGETKEASLNSLFGTCYLLATGKSFNPDNDTIVSDNSDSTGSIKVSSIEVVKDINNFTKTAKFTVSKSSYIRNGNKIYPLFDNNRLLYLESGSYIKLEYGYDGFDLDSFEGFLTSYEIKNDMIIIELEDYSFFLKRTKFNFSKDTLELEELGKTILSQMSITFKEYAEKLEYPFLIEPSKYASDNVDENGEYKTVDNWLSVKNNVDMKIEKFRAANSTGIKILELLKKEFLLQSFFNGSTLEIGVNFKTEYINKQVDDGNYKQHYFTTISNGIISSLKSKTNNTNTYGRIIDYSNLEYKDEGDIKFKITAKVISNDGVETFETGDETGEQRTMIIYKEEDKEEIQTLIDTQIEKWKYSGYQKGSYFSTFGGISPNLLDIITLDIGEYKIDPLNNVIFKGIPTSSYFLNKITTVVNKTIRNKMYLGKRVVRQENTQLKNSLVKGMNELSDNKDGINVVVLPFRD